MSRIIEKFKLFKENNRKKFYQTNTGTQFAKEFRFNFFPGIVIIALIFAFLLVCIDFVFYISEFLEWFIQVLEIPKVLKLPFLANKDFYRLPALGIYIYLSLAILYDLASFLKENWGVRWILTDDSLFIAQRKWFNWKIIKLPKAKILKNWEWNRGYLLDLFAMNSMKLIYKEKEYKSGFFSPKKNADLLKKQFQQR